MESDRRADYRQWTVKLVAHNSRMCAARGEDATITPYCNPLHDPEHSFSLVDHKMGRCPRPNIRFLPDHHLLIHSSLLPVSS